MPCEQADVIDLWHAGREELNRAREQIVAINTRERVEGYFLRTDNPPTGLGDRENRLAHAPLDEGTAGEGAWTNFGINLTHLDPGAVSALRHWHSVQDEFVYVLEGAATVVFGDTEYQLLPGDCIGFKAGTGIAHQVVNRTDERVTYIEVGDRSPGEKGEFSEADLTFQIWCGWQPDSYAHGWDTVLALYSRPLLAEARQIGGGRST
jgi:uncharacterized cupin superfamily protein